MVKRSAWSLFPANHYHSSCLLFQVVEPVRTPSLSQFIFPPIDIIWLYYPIFAEYIGIEYIGVHSEMSSARDY